MGQEIIADKKDEEHPVINSLFEIERERDLWDVELDFEIFAQDGDIEKYEGFFLGWLLLYFSFGSSTLCCVVSLLTTGAACTGTGILEKDILTKNFEVG